MSFFFSSNLKVPRYKLGIINLKIDTIVYMIANFHDLSSSDKKQFFKKKKKKKKKLEIRQWF
jgi:hypothetical protein